MNIYDQAVSGPYPKVRLKDRNDYQSTCKDLMASGDFGSFLGCGLVKASGFMDVITTQSSSANEVVNDTQDNEHMVFKKEALSKADSQIQYRIEELERFSGPRRPNHIMREYDITCLYEKL